MIACSLSLYFIYPTLSKGYKNEAVKTKKISNYINKHRDGFRHPTIFFDISNKEIGWHHAFHFGVKEETRSYIFSRDKMPNISSISEEIDEGFSDLRKFGKQDFDTTYTYFVTDQKVSLQRVIFLDFMDLGNVYFISWHYT